MLQPRKVDADFLWGMFMTNRLFVGGWGRTPDPNYTTQMLEMWHSENPCYSALESEVVKLSGESNLPPLEFLRYMEHLNAQLSPCIEDQLQSISGLQFFDNAPTVRNQRITMWFDRTWEDADDGTFPFADDCRTRFYSHLPEAIAAGDPPHLESAWASAMVVVSGCARDAMRDYFAFLDISEPQLKQLPPDDRYTAVSLQMTMIGHLLAVDLGKPSGECWPDYANRIPQVAATTDADEMIAARTPPSNPCKPACKRLPPTTRSPIGEVVHARSAKPRTGAATASLRNRSGLHIATPRYHQTRSRHPTGHKHRTVL